MSYTRKITDSLYWIGDNDRRLHLFENIHPIERGVSYNSYVLLDEKNVLFDTVDWSVCRDMLESLEKVLAGRKLDYVVINHMEPDHAACLEEVLIRYPETKVISNEKAFMLMHQFGFHIDGRTIEVKEGDVFEFGKHKITFVNAPMVHWPEAMVSFEITEGILFSADAFGSFGTLDGKLFADEFDFKNEWIDDARRYYTNIVGKYGPHVMSLLGKAPVNDIKYVCPLHGPVWKAGEDLMWFIDKYVHWATYEPEEKGVMIVYASMYGNTESAATLLASKLCEKGMTKVRMYDVSKTHVSFLISDLFKYSHIVFASVTYNLGIFPPMHNFLMDMKALNLQKRTCAIMENGSWAPKAASLIAEALDEMKEMSIVDPNVTVTSAVNGQSDKELDTLADAIIDSMK
ncbi:FprA family A-type flavoprotein [Bacteroides heparinolyticus]|uniref:FprA family A-type flavoprotein n=1 Tax=Prevotella heparinolytica TaxID=28113 RepID=UPI0035A137E6